YVAAFGVGMPGKNESVALQFGARQSLAKSGNLRSSLRADMVQIVGSFADRGDTESYAEDHSLKDWWGARVISPEAFAESQRRRLRELRPAARRSEVSEVGSFPPRRLKR